MSGEGFSISYISSQMDIAVEHIGNVHEQLVGLYHQLDRSLRCQKNYFVSGGPEAKKGGSEGVLCPILGITMRSVCAPENRSKAGVSPIGQE